MKVLLSVEERLLRRIDEKAKSQGVTRSAYLAKLAQEDIAHVDVGSALSRLDRIFRKNPSEDATAAIRSGRDAR